MYIIKDATTKKEIARLPPSIVLSAWLRSNKYKIVANNGNIKYVEKDV